ncbi:MULTISPECIES: hypothetical protein [unclassified Bradyrhizobium]|uniref:hypothetical protein n=1 Tax=unclassified Bradyrhizobium TaxID=2631580 RepID=UPI0024E16664|nr:MULTISPECIES: hypothetical protein [unclassified Bradyrhizobium]
MPDHRLFDSTSLTSPPEPRVEAVSNNMTPEDEGFMPERQPFPAIACALAFLNDIIKDAPPPPPEDLIDAILRRLCIDGEAFIRIGSETYRITDLGGRFRCELVEKKIA